MDIESPTFMLQDNLKNSDNYNISEILAKKMKISSTNKDVLDVTEDKIQMPIIEDQIFMLPLSYDQINNEGKIYSLLVIYFFLDHDNQNSVNIEQL